MLQISLRLSLRTEARSQRLWRCALGELQEKTTCSAHQQTASHLHGRGAPSAWRSLKQPAWGQGTERQSLKVPLWFPKGCSGLLGKQHLCGSCPLTALPSSSEGSTWGWGSSSSTFSCDAAESLLFLLSLQLRQATQGLGLADGKKRYPAFGHLSLFFLFVFPSYFSSHWEGARGAFESPADECRIDF